jgi:hypothetical protein
VDNAPSLDMVDPVGAESAAGVSESGTERSLRTRVAAILFPPSAERSGRRWRSVLFSVLFIAAASAASLLRQTGVSAVNSMWAEDGQVFYQAVFKHNFLRALFSPNNGYLDLQPRLFIEVLGHVPVAYAAEAFAVVGALVGSLVAVAVFHASEAHVPSRAMRLCMAVPTAVIIVGQGEVGNSIVNCQWYMIYGFFWMLLWTPRTVWGRIAAALLLCGAIGSDPITVVFVPLLAVRLWALPWRESPWQLGGVLLGAAYQAVGFIKGDTAKRPQIPNYNPRIAETSYRHDIIAHTLASSHELSFIGLRTLMEAEFAGLGALIVIGALGAWLARPKWLMAGLCLVFSIAFHFMLVMQGGKPYTRYDVVPALLLISAAVFLAMPPTRSAADAASDNRRGFGRAALLPAAVLCVVLGLNFAASYEGGIPSRGTSAPWNSQVHAATEACKQSGVKQATLVIAPGAPWYWKVDVPCSALR